MLIETSALIKRIPIYYGWIILLVGTIGLILTSPGQTYAVSIFIEHFITDFGISRSLVSALYTGGTLVASFLLPSIGRQIDIRGSRQMMVVIAVSLALACLYMGSVQNVVMLGFGFVAIRLAGQGSLSLVSNNVVNQWWVRRRGMATGLAGVGIALFGIGGFPNLIQQLINRYDWRLTYVILGILVAVVMIPLALFLVRDTPESVGLEPDGSKPDKELSPILESPTPEKIIIENTFEENWTRAQAIRTVPFWILSLSGMSIAMLSTGLFFHLVSIFTDNGFSFDVAVSVLIPAAISTAVFNIIGGFLSDRIDVRIILAVSLLIMAAALISAPFMNTILLATIFGVMLGGLGGLSRVVNAVVWPNYFGRKHLGSISGLATTILVLGAALGPMPIGIARDVWGNYNLILPLLAVIPLALAVATVLFGKKPKTESTAFR
jgi:sugar phosphate permease